MKPPLWLHGGDGSTMDTDLVPGTTGVEYDTEFVFNTCVGPSAGMSDRLSDVILIGYSDGTSVTIEELDSTGKLDHLGHADALDGGEVLEWGTNMDSNTVLRITSDKEIHVQLSHASSEFAWSVF